MGKGDTARCERCGHYFASEQPSPEGNYCLDCQKKLVPKRITDDPVRRFEDDPTLGIDRPARSRPPSPPNELD